MSMSRKSGAAELPERASCRRCGFANPAGFRFCGACGARLPASDASAIIQRRGVAERRQLTVLFCDLVGSTRLATNLELEELRDVLRAFQATCAEAVRTYEGTISRFMGDGILVLFGYPQAHEDDAERAVRAGLAMVESVGRLSPPNAAMGPLAARVGIATGVVVAGDLIGDGSAEEEAILGETPNLAGRLHTSAPPDSVVIAPSTRALLGGRFLCEDLGAHRVKGFAEPVRRWRVIRPRSVASHFMAASSADRAPLVGREEELAWLLGLWQSASGGGGRIAMVAGEAGIGKSRLAEALRERLGDACVPLRFQCSPHYINRALHPVIQHIERGARIGLEDTSTARLEKLTGWLRPEVRDADEIAVLAALLSISADAAPALPPMSVQRRKMDTFEILLRLLQERAAVHPCLIIIEDLHWADPSTLEFLSALVSRIQEMAALAILTFRPVFAEPWAAEHVEGRELRRLTKEPALSLVEHVAGGGRMPATMLEQVVVMADGIPLFIEELTHAVLGLGPSEEAQGEPLSSASPIPSPAIPATLQDSLMARLDQLGSAKLVAQQASAIGREFAYPLLKAISPLPEERLQSDLDALQEAGLVRAKDPGAVGVYAFKHILVQEVAYQTLLRNRRQGLHTSIAEVLLEQFPQESTNAPELLAHHWTQAGRTELALASWQAAGERASERSEYVEAIGHLRKGLDLIADLPDAVERRARELALLLALGPALMMVIGAGTSEVVSLYSRALALCAEKPKSELHFAARWGSWLVAMDHRAGLRRADELLQLAQELGDPAHLVQAHHCQWATLYMLGAHEECRRHADEGIRLYDPERHNLQAHLYGGHDPKVCALGERALSCWLLGRLDEGMDSIRRALEWADSLAHVGSRAHAMDYALQVHRLRRDAFEVSRRADSMAAFAIEQRLGEHRAKAMLFRGWARAVLGDVSGGYSEMRDALAGEEAAGAPDDFPLYYEMFAEVCEQARRFDEGLDAVNKGFAEADRGRLVYWNAELYRRRGEILLAAGAEESAVRDCFESALSSARAQGALFLELRAAASLVRLRCGASGVGEPVASLRAAYAGFFDGHDAPDLREARALLAVKP